MAKGHNEPLVQELITEAREVTVELRTAIKDWKAVKAEVREAVAVAVADEINRQTIRQLEVMLADMTAAIADLQKRVRDEVRGYQAQSIEAWELNQRLIRHLSTAERVAPVEEMQELHQLWHDDVPIVRRRIDGH